MGCLEEPTELGVKVRLASFCGVAYGPVESMFGMFFGDYFWWDGSAVVFCFVGCTFYCRCGVGRLGCCGFVGGCGGWSLLCVCWRPGGAGALCLRSLPVGAPWDRVTLPFNNLLQLELITTTAASLAVTVFS